MKTAQQIIGLPVVSIFDGNEIGKVKNVIINAAKGTIDFFVIDSGIRSLAGGVIPADRVLGIGEYALTIEQPDDISDIVKIPAAIELLQKNITVRGSRVLTRKGSLLGETGDIYIDEDNAYTITGVEFIPSNSDTCSGIIPRSSIITFGKNLLVVQDDFIDNLMESPCSLVGEQKKNEVETEQVNVEPEVHAEQADVKYDYNIPLSEETEDLYKLDGFEPESSVSGNLPEEGYNSLPDADFSIMDEAAPADATVLEEPAKVSESAPLSAAELFEQRQRQHLLGKRVTKTISDSAGRIIAHEGDTITDQIIDDAKKSGKLIELVMNYEE
ncbi:MAG: hypothetical protein GXX10_06455 [Clostridiaceae bacterium]|nr:hypothetical protein [Clostridiaceae bacterium]